MESYLYKVAREQTPMSSCRKTSNSWSSRDPDSKELTPNITSVTEVRPWNEEKSHKIERKISFKCFIPYFVSSRDAETVNFLRLRLRHQGNPKMAGPAILIKYIFEFKKNKTLFNPVFLSWTNFISSAHSSISIMNLWKSQTTTCQSEEVCKIYNWCEDNM